jgi:3-oxoacyl-[acyl-carrier-protein] synthase II
MRRVVVTGLGVVSPVGIGVDAMWASITSGTSGVKPISAFDVSEYPVRFAATVDDWDAGVWLDAKEARRMSRFQQFALALTQLTVGVELEGNSIVGALGHELGEILGPYVIGVGE